MKKINFITVLVLLILISGIGFASAEILTGELGSDAWNSTNFVSTTQNTQSCYFKTLWFNDIQNVGAPISYIYFETISLWTLDSGAPGTATTPVIFRQSNGTWNSQGNPKQTDGDIIGYGTIGYVRLYNTATPPIEQLNGYVYIIFNSFNVTGLSGDTSVYLDYNRNALYNITGYQTGTQSAPVGTGMFMDLTGSAYGSHTFNKQSTVHAVYEVEKPAGLGISGWVNKTNGIGGIFFYNCQVFIADLNYKTIASEGTLSPDKFTFTTNATQIRICLLDALGSWVNSSLLFAAGEGNLTGTHNITFHIMTYQGANIYNAKVVFASKPVVGKTIEEVAVTGYTNASGMVTFYNQTAGATAIVQVTATGYKDYVATFSFTLDMIKEIRMSSPSVDLYVNIRDSSTGHYMEDFQVGIKNTTSGTWRNSTQEVGSLYFDSTGVNYEYPLSLNETVILAAAKAGYIPDWKSVTIPYDMYTTTLYLINLNATAPSAGNFTAVIAVSDQKTGTGIQGASVNIQGLGRAGTTTTAGAVTFRNIAAGSYTLSVSAPGYQSRISDLTGTDGDTVLKSIQLLPEGCSISEGGTMICDGSIVVPGMTPITNQTANEKAAGGVTAFLDNIVSIGTLILIGIVFWFGKKIIFS
jgi:hypothetical protein